ncbi:hypothetical protein HER10_EVM0006798 [Colletotrichum scovillei]|uniref:Uncharacterized protein n=1 Tax=Colletotrichum scovillei TaxID=1209932 RepID=A0A9P7UC68_9PEZI|nr:uncharacterized protein HER10_EVM0006798 [Colletotrichum scovillei]KAF4782039.1 hypothetical protein HER10_EVM0006798 [Colletotrichum scovillei]KAG7050764.1 hypothetical protein JMJ77_0013504 [Colletotrichum scovillei]KAG7069808.1 hypothetical protein JMJ76_0003468 [Colletotrichum scovillei]KAG7073721.1 hypothetical protein JMJ78_0014689 [Colletotrichum scovillei]
MGFTWPSLGRWTSNRRRPSRSSREPYRHRPTTSTTKTSECYSPTTDQAPEDEDEDRESKYNCPQNTHSYDTPDISMYGGDLSPIYRISAPPAQGVRETELLLRGESPAALIKLIRRTEDAERRVRGNEKFKHFGEDEDAPHVRFGTTTTVYGGGGEGASRYDDGWALSLAEEDRRRDEAAVREEYGDDFDEQEFGDWRDGGCGCECGRGERDEEDEKLEEERDEAEEVIRHDHSRRVSWAVDESSRPCGHEAEEGANTQRHRSEAQKKEIGEAMPGFEVCGVVMRDGLRLHPMNGAVSGSSTTVQGPGRSLTARQDGMEMTLVDYSSDETSTAEEDPSDGEGSRSHLPSLYFEDLRRMVEEAVVPDPLISGADVVDGTGDDQTNEAESKSTPDTEVLFDFSEYSKGHERSIGDMLDSFSEEFEGWQNDTDEEENPPSTPAHDIIRPVAGLGWYDDNERSSYSDVRPQALIMSLTRADTESNTASESPLTFPLRKDSLEHSPRALTFSGVSCAAEKGDGFTTTEAGKFNRTPMRTLFDNTSQFFQSTTVEDDHWISTPRSPTSPRRSSSVYSSDSSGNEGSLSPTSKTSPTSPSEGEEDEEEIDDLLDIYATTSHSHHGNPLFPATDKDLLPPYHHSSPSALVPLTTIARGLSLPQTTPYNILQTHLARNANILRYLVLHCIPSPSINPLEPQTNLVEPILPLPLSPGSGEYAQNFPSHPRRREYTRLLQAIRSVQWSADAINDMLAVVDFHSPLPSPSSPSFSTYTSHRRASTALPAFRKLRAADAERRGYLTSAQLHELSMHGISLLDVLQMNDVPRVVSSGLGGRLVAAAASGALSVARECNLLDEEGALLELLADPEEEFGSRSKSRDQGRRSGRGSGLRCCIGVDDEGEVGFEEEGADSDDKMDDDEDEGYGEGTRFDGLVDEMDTGPVVDDGAYLVSPLSPEAFTADQIWEDQGGVASAPTTSQPSEDLMTFSEDGEEEDEDDIYDPPTDCTLEQPEADLRVKPLNIPKKKPTLKRSHSFREIDNTGEETSTAVLVDNETGEDPELRRFFNEIGAMPVVAGTSDVVIE